MHVSEQETPLWLLVTESGPSVTQYDLARTDGYPLVSGRGQLCRTLGGTAATPPHSPRRQGAVRPGCVTSPCL